MRQFTWDYDLEVCGRVLGRNLLQPAASFSTRRSS
jgi:hypothetical protein